MVKKPIKASVICQFVSEKNDVYLQKEQSLSEMINVLFLQKYKNAIMKKNCVLYAF